MTEILKGIRVLDFFWLGAGAWASKILAGYGAEVIRIEWREDQDCTRIRPDLIYLASSGFGVSGPYRDYGSYGPIAAAMSGLTAMGAFPGAPAAGWGYSYTDVMAPWFTVMALLSALRIRRRTGRGQFID